jgi:TRAP-type C4-dicarboxylate transport system permease small subunit
MNIELTASVNEKGAKKGAKREVRPARALLRFATAVAAFMNYVAGWNFILCAAFITTDVLCRNLAGFSSSATTEITSYMLAFGIAWGLAHALATRSHIRIDVLVNRLPMRLRQYLHTFALVLLTALVMFLTWCAWGLVNESILFNAKDTSALAIPLVIPQGLWAIGITMLAVFALVLLLEVVCLLVAGKPDEIDRMLGPRGYQEETQEALEAVGLTPVAGADARDPQP